VSWLAIALFAGKHLLAFLLLAATAWVAGRTALRRLDSGEGWERLAVPGALGLTILAHVFLALGFCGLLSRGPVLAVLVAVHLLGFRAWREVLSFGWWRPLSRVGGEVGWGRAATAAGLLAFAPLFVFSLYPPTAFDETLYHLPYAEAFARTGGVPFLPDLRNPVFPQLEELLQAAVLLFAGDVATHLVQLLAVLLTAALLAGWGRRAGGPAAGWLAAGLFLGNPIVAHLAGTGYVEPGLTLFATAAVYSLERWRESGGDGWLILAAVFAGSAGGVKYLGLYFVGLVLLGVLLITVRERRWRDLLVAGLAVLAVLAPWYGRILYYTGNPIFPFFPDLFPGPPSPWDPGGLPVPRGLEERLIAFLRLPWDVVLDRSAVGNQPPYSPAWLLGLPLLVVGFVREARVRRLLAAGAGYALIFLLLPPDARYLVAVLPLLSLALALAVAARVSRRLAAALALVVLLPGWLYAGYRIWLQGPVPATAQAREEYLVRQLPVYPAVRSLNRSLGSRYTVYAFNAENMTYFADGRFLGDWNGPARYARLIPHLQEPAALWRELRTLGADHFLVAKGTGVHLPVDDPAFPRWFRQVYSDSAADVYALAPWRRSRD
jgi:hypothetical protein